MDRQYWVIGGEYVDTGFRELIEGSAQLHGPYQNHDSALRRWRSLADATRGNCHTRFTIVHEHPGI